MDKERFELDHALGIAEGLIARLRPACVPGFILLAGSARRLAPDVGDVEIVYVSLVERGPSKDDFFKDEPINRVDEIIADLFQSRVLDKRKNVNGNETFGPWNKLMRHVATRIPVDLFATKPECFWNYMVCRTGPTGNNVAIANAAIAKGWKWNPYGEGFTDNEGNVRRVTSEREVFELVGLPYREPWDR